MNNILTITNLSKKYKGNDKYSVRFICFNIFRSYKILLEPVVGGLVKSFVFKRIGKILLLYPTAETQALVVATSALTAYQNIGLPEGKIPLYNAIIYVCEAPKSNSVVIAKYAVEEVVATRKDDKVPSYLMDKNYKAQKISGPVLVFPPNKARRRYHYL